MPPWQLLLGLSSLYPLMESSFGNSFEHWAQINEISGDRPSHYNDAIMIINAMASQITSLTTVYSTVYSGTDERKHQSSMSLAFLWGECTVDRWIPRTKGQQRGKCFYLMTSYVIMRWIAVIWLKKVGQQDNSTMNGHHEGTYVP